MASNALKVQRSIFSCCGRQIIYSVLVPLVHPWFTTHVPLGQDLSLNLVAAEIHFSKTSQAVVK